MFEIKIITAKQDLMTCADIWLEASIQAHHFINDEFWQNNYQAMLDNYLPSATVYAVYHQQQVIAFAAMLEAHILAAIFIRPQYWRQGIGKKLITHISQLYPQIVLSVYEQNKCAIHFYKKLGFSIIEHGECTYTGHNELTMQKIN